MRISQPRPAITAQPGTPLEARRQIATPEPHATTPEIGLTAALVNMMRAPIPHQHTRRYRRLAKRLVALADIDILEIIHIHSLNLVSRVC
jgi:hypothetical protein